MDVRLRIARTPPGDRHTRLAIFLILRAFSAGTTALTGVEAISNGVPAFRYPQSKNAATTLTMMGVLSISMFLGISWLANKTQVIYTEESPAHRGGPEIARRDLRWRVHVLRGAGHDGGQSSSWPPTPPTRTFPRLISILAHDRFMPRQFMNRGDRLVFSNGIVILAVLAAALIVIFDANLNSLIQLYLVGVFISFTLSQAGMVVHWRRSQSRVGDAVLAINGFGAVRHGSGFLRRCDDEVPQRSLDSGGLHPGAHLHDEIDQCSLH